MLPPGVTGVRVTSAPRAPVQTDPCQFRAASGHQPDPASCSAVCLTDLHSQGEKRQLQIQQCLSWYNRGKNELQKLPKQWLHSLTQKLFPGLAYSLSWRALEDDSCVTVTCCLIETGFVPTCPHLSSLTLWHNLELSEGCWK